MKELTIEPDVLARKLAALRGKPHAEYESDSSFDPREYKPAAVLVPLLWYEGEWHLLFTRRSSSLMNHGGQVAFPGGSWDVEDEDLIATARREAWEEVGLRPEDVRVLGDMSAIGIITRFLVTPVVGIIPWPYPLRLQEAEVARAFIVPLSWLANPGNFYTSTRIYEGKSYEIGYYQLYDGEKIWGATAQMTREFLKLIN
ncbi:MAG TPA: CoA pyrophosphatase [Anaerolineaceae bacterium]|nr:CoA pyrophosphatase [Anaerolineaceae bacterium]HPS32931.1 CoA pyrophosphatase [Anaerolineaceae bacterium]